MEVKNKTSLKRKMVFYFLLVAFANVFVGIELLVDSKNETYRKSVVEKVVKIKTGEEPETSIFTVLDKLTGKFVIMVGVLILVSAVILFLFVIQIASPIQYMINEAKKIAEGDLSVTLNMKSKDEISDLGNLINDLTVNLQEIIVQLQRTHASFEEALVWLEIKLTHLPEIQKHFKNERRLLRDNVEHLAMIRESFTIYQMRKFNTGDFAPDEKSLMDSLLENNEITRDQYSQALEHHRERGGFIGAILRDLEIVDDHVLLKYLTKG